MDLTENELDKWLPKLTMYPSLWISRPKLLATLRAYTHIGFHRRLGKKLSAITLASGKTESYYYDDAGNLFVWSTANQRYAFGSLVPDQEDRIGRGPRIMGRPTRNELHHVESILNSAVEESNGELGPYRAAMKHLLLMAEAKFQSYRQLLTTLRPARVLVSTQHSVHARCLSLACSLAEIPTIYIPHAPYATNRYYADLPFDYAGLRGRREQEAYVALGGAPDRLSVVGNLSLDDRFSTRLADTKLPPVVAPSPWDEEVVRNFMLMSAKGIDGQFIVSPHPRSDLKLLRRLTPTRAIISNTRTSKVLLRGPAALVQHGSGVAVEALLLGLPVIDVEIDGLDSTYPSIAPPHVTFVTAPAEIASRLADVRTEDDSGRLTRQEWAKGWSSPVGSHSVRKLQSLLQERLLPGDPILDGWRSH